ncbi:heat shock cognate 71 kDa protein isoform X2 [Leptinotarsa decemlineata]|uniref:heat shock cognate 71 kDa protein isoform X2 n=1 Tax=Leptinotarsa decemlineata TaxID=7539 RepID=UPI003D30C094
MLCVTNIGKSPQNKMSDIPIGIDLGTTFSCIAAYRKGRAEIIPDQNGDRLIPSIVFFDPQTGAVHVGKTADKLSPKCPRNCLKDSKRIIGRKFDDEFISRYHRQKNIQFSLVRGVDDKAVYQLDVKYETVTKTPEEVSAEILKYLKRMASDYLGRGVTEVVVSIPAYFSNGQRKATKKAVELAGLKLLKFITEPSAGALHYVQDKNVATKLLVFDWGGGTLDVSLVEVKNKIFEVKSVYGDTLCGGRNIDERLFDHFYRPVDKDRFARRLQQACEDLKKQLSSLDEFSTVIECYDGFNDFELSLTKSKFEKLTEDIFQNAIDIVEYGLDDAGWKKSEVKEIVLVGGSTRIPKIRNMLDNLFRKKILKTDLNPDEAVAIGACLQAAMLKNEFASAEKYKLTEVTPLSLGVGVHKDLMSTIIRRNTSLPAKFAKCFITSENNQETCSFTIYEGERKNTKYNNVLGDLILEGLPLKRSGDVKMEVTFFLDEDGILTVTASENSTGKFNKIVVTLGEFRISERKMKVSVAEAAKHKSVDDVFEQFQLTRNKLQEKCQHILYDLDRISNESDRNLVEEKCEMFLDYSENLDFIESEELESHFSTFYTAVSHILNVNQLQQLNY